jgi:hypothetical protein
MIVPFEIMLRGNDTVFTERIDQPGEPVTWRGEDVKALLVQVLQAIDRILQGAASARPVSLRGMNWIVSPYGEGVVIALEIHSASAVAGPFHVAASALEALIVSALGSTPPGITVH